MATPRTVSRLGSAGASILLGLRTARRLRRIVWIQLPVVETRNQHKMHKIDTPKEKRMLLDYPEHYTAASLAEMYGWNPQTIMKVMLAEKVPSLMLHDGTRWHRCARVRDWELYMQESPLHKGHQRTLSRKAFAHLIKKCRARIKKDNFRLPCGYVIFKQLHEVFGVSYYWLYNNFPRTLDVKVYQRSAPSPAIKLTDFCKKYKQQKVMKKGLHKHS